MACNSSSSNISSSSSRSSINTSSNNISSISSRSSISSSSMVIKAFVIALIVLWVDIAAMVAVVVVAVVDVVVSRSSSHCN
jgi:uncharacterized membrane protein